MWVTEQKNNGIILILLPALIWFFSCGGLYRQIAPEQKQKRTMLLTPDNSRQGKIVEVVLQISVPGETNYISSFGFGKGIEVLRYISTDASECTDAGTKPNPETDDYTYTVCLLLEVLDDAPTGERAVTIDVESNSVAILAKASFFVLPALLNKN